MTGDNEPPLRSAEEHLAASEAALTEIAADNLNRGVQPICHHFDEANPVDPVLISVEATYRHNCPVFAAAGLEFLSDRLEAWETSEPSREWLKKRVPELLAIACQARLHYRGWTWEPTGRQPICATDFRVVNNRTT